MLEAGKYYHIYNRGNNREDLFKEEKNYSYFLKLYEHHIEPVAETYAYCLMRNHFHLLIKIKDLEHLPGFRNLEGVEHNPEVVKTPSRAFSNLFNAYTKSINKMYGRTGSLFEKNFRRIEVDSEQYFARLIHYIHFNPQQHHFMDDYRGYPHSSYQLVLSEEETIVQRRKVIEWFGGRKELLEFHANASFEKEIIHYVGDDEQ